MKEVVIILLILALYIFVSYCVRKLLLKVKLGLFIIVCIGYALFTNYLFDLLIYFHQWLRSKGIYLEFGHAEIVLLEVFAVCILIGLINITSVLIKKYRRAKGAPKFKNDAGT
jgi:hypothetical protein